MIGQMLTEFLCNTRRPNIGQPVEREYLVEKEEFGCLGGQAEFAAATKTKSKMLLSKQFGEEPNGDLHAIWAGAVKVQIRLTEQ